MSRGNPRPALAALFAFAALLTSCSSDGSATDNTPAATNVPDTTVASETSAVETTTAPTDPPTTAAPAPLVVLVTNDDGIGAEGFDAMVNALAAVPGLELHIVAPATNQSGTSDKVTDGEVTVQDATTLSGVKGIAVNGFPADCVNYALDVLGLQPDLVVSGTNKGQNVGPLTAVSGTIGAARTAARRGIPAVAVSTGLSDTLDYATSAKVAVDEVTAHLAEYGWGTNADKTVVNLNIPTCPAGTTMKGVVDVPVATELQANANGLPFDCASTVTAPVDDVDALNNGFAPRSIVPADL